MIFFLSFLLSQSLKYTNNFFFASQIHKFFSEIQNFYNCYVWIDHQESWKEKNKDFTDVEQLSICS